MLEKLILAGDACAANAVAEQIKRLAQNPTPPGITAEPIHNGVALTGKRLRRRMLDDPQLRNFGR